MPSLFLAHRQVAWVELEAGNELHVRLLHAGQVLPGTTLIERLVARADRGRHHGQGAASADRGHLSARRLLAGGRRRRPPSAADSPLVRRPGGRRRGAQPGLVVLPARPAAGFTSCWNGSPSPCPKRPMPSSPSGASGCSCWPAAFGGASGGPGSSAKPSWPRTTVGHLVKGVDVEEALVAVAVALYLLYHRDAFGATADPSSTRRGLSALVAGAVSAVLAGTLGVEIGTMISRGTHHRRMPLPRAFTAASARLVGLRDGDAPRSSRRLLRPGHDGRVPHLGAGRRLPLLPAGGRPTGGRRRRQPGPGPRHRPPPRRRHPRLLRPARGQAVLLLGRQPGGLRRIRRRLPRLP